VSTTSPDLGTAQFISGAPGDLVALLEGRLLLDGNRGPVTGAALTWTALGIVDARVDGHRVDGQFLVPGWTAYERRLRVASADLPLPEGDEIVVTLQLAPGWYAGRLGWRGQRAVYGDTPSAAARLVVTFADGGTQELVTDGQWSIRTSTVVAADLYDGQRVDFCRDDSVVSAARRVPSPDVDLVPLAGPVRCVTRLSPVDVRRLGDHRILIDFGQVLTGWVRLHARGERGAEIRLRHTEVLEHGELSRRPLRSALAEDTLVLSGGDDTFEPSLTVHGFRYVEVVGWPGTLDELQDAACATALSSTTAQRGRFSCSDPLLTRLHENVVWSTRGNFLTLPTDCPQRDERLGWTGDIAVFAPTAAYLFDVGGLLGDWLRDLWAEQELNGGRVPHVVPDILKHLDDPGDLPAADTAIWGDAALWVPWALWIAYGDPTVLHAQYASMTAHAERVERLLSPASVWAGGFQFGDWLDPMAPAEDPFRARADPDVVATACAFRTFSTLADTAEVLHDAAGVARWRSRAQATRRGFRDTYVRDGRITSDCETVYALAIAFDLLDAADEAAAGRRLAELVEASGFRVMTGFAGTPYLLDALVRTGYVDHAARVLQQTEIPSWLYPVTMGATTIWERWDSMLPDGSINPGEMTSFNHYAFGAVADFLHRRVGGIAPAAPGYAEIDVNPLVGLGGLTWAETSQETSRGTIRVRWERVDGQDTLDIDVPEGAFARVDSSWTRDTRRPTLPAGRHLLTRPTGMPI